MITQIGLVVNWKGIKIMIFNELFEEYLLNRRILGLKESTISTYTKFYEAQLKDYFGNVDLQNFNDTLISTFILKIFDKKLSRKYIKNIVGLLYSILDYAKIKYREYPELLYIEKRRIKTDREEIKIFTEVEQNRLEEYIISNKTPVNIGFLLMFYTGIRIGELCALKIKDIDLDEQCLYIKYTMQRVKNISSNSKKKTKIIIDRPKSSSSIRKIPLSDFLIPILRNSFKGVDNSAFFLTNSDKFIEPRSMENNFKKLLKKLEIDYKSPHKARHTFATTMLYLGVDEKSLSEWLGHSSTAITLNEYVHPTFSKKVEQANLLNQKFLDKHK